MQGEEAVILSSRRLDEGGIEVAAAVDYDAALMGEAAPFQCAFRSLAQSSTSSTRRLRARPASVSLDSIGRFAPNP